jgi:peptide/nickel transport system substrate-binding protein
MDAASRRRGKAASTPNQVRVRLSGTRVDIRLPFQFPSAFVIFRMKVVLLCIAGTGVQQCKRGGHPVLKVARLATAFLLAVSVVATASIAASAAGATHNSAASGGTLTIAFSQDLDTLDPAVTGTTAVNEIDVNVFDTLAYDLPNGNPTPDLATSWKVSDGGRVYTLQLRKGVTFTDGTPFNAAAVVFNFERILNPATKAVGAQTAIGPLKSAKATGEYTVVLTFSAPFPAFASYMGSDNLGMQSPTAIKKEGANYGLHPVGTGPFMVQSYRPDSSLVLVRNPKYDWAPPALKHNGPAKLAKIVFDLVEDNGTRVDEYLSGQAQELDATPPLYYKKLGGVPGNVKFPVPIPGAGEYAAINNAKWPTNQLAVRQAILYDVNRPGLVEFADQGQYPVSWGPLQVGTPGYDPALNNMYPYDPAKGAEVLEKAGWKKVNGIWTKDGKKLTLLITTISAYQDLPDFAVGIQGYLQKAGMVVTIKEYGGTEWLSNTVKGVENITPLWLSNTNPDLLRLLFTPGEYFNWSMYNNPTVTKILDEAEVNTNPTSRLQQYDKAQTLLMQQAVMLPERVNEDLILLKSTVKGVIDYFGGNPYYYETTVG